MHGTRAANYAMDEADLIVAIGARFDDRITGKLSEFAPAGEVHPHRHRPGGDLQERPGPHPDRGRRQADRLAGWSAEYRALEPDPARLSGWWERIEHWRAQHPLRYDDSPDTEIKPQHLVQALYEATGGGSASSPPTSASTRCGRRSTSTSPSRGAGSTRGGLGTMGFGLPAAIGAAVALPGHPERAAHRRRLVPDEHPGARRPRAQFDIPVKCVIMDNGYLGMVRQWQELFWDRRYSQRRHGHVAGLGQARRRLRRDRRAADRQDARWSTTCARRWPRRAR